MGNSNACIVYYYFECVHIGKGKIIPGSPAIWRNSCLTCCRGGHQPSQRTLLPKPNAIVYYRPIPAHHQSNPNKTRHKIQPAKLVISKSNQLKTVSTPGGLCLFMVPVTDPPKKNNNNKKKYLNF